MSNAFDLTPPPSRRGREISGTAIPAREQYRGRTRRGRGCAPGWSTAQSIPSPDDSPLDRMRYTPQPKVSVMSPHVSKKNIALW